MIAWVAGAAWAHVPVIYVAGPDDWCEALAGTIGNDYVLLEAGEYRGPCTFDARPSNVDAELTTLQSLDPSRPAVFVGTDGDHVLAVTGRRAVVLAVTFRGLPEAVTALRIDGPAEAWVRGVTFEDVAGTAVRAEGPDVHVVDSTFRGGGTAIDAACGEPCGTALATSRNHVAGAAIGVRAAAGARVTLSEDGISAHDGVRCAGALSARGLLVEAAGTGIEWGEGTVAASVVRAPVALRADGGAGAVAALGVTVLGAVSAPGWGPDDRWVGCALDGPPPAGGVVSGTVACDPARACFVDASALDVYPRSDGRLPGAGADAPDLGPDWCGRARGSPPTAGALEWVGPVGPGPLSLVPAGDRCGDPTRGHTGADPDGHTGRPPDPTSPPPVVEVSSGGGCGCAPRPRGGGAVGAMVGACVAGCRRRTRRTDILADCRTGPP